MRRSRASALIACALACAQAGEARAWHRHHHEYRYLTVRAASAPFPGPVALPGYHCPPGQWWRPSLRVCQGVPYGGTATLPLVAPPAAAVAVLPPDAAPRSVPGAIGARTVSTDTRVVGRRRWRTRDGSTTTYTVVTKVVERSPR